MRPRPASPDRLTPDRGPARLARRLAVVAVLSFVAIRAIPPLLALWQAKRPAATPPTLASRTAAVAPRGPGRLIGAFEADDVAHSISGWALLDRSEGEVIVLDTAGAPVRRLGRRGEGPGELSRPVDLALDPDAGLAVLDASGQRVDLFPPAGLPFRVAIPPEGCTGTFGDEILRHAGAWWTLRRCFNGVRAELEVHRLSGTTPAERVERRPLTLGRTDPHLAPLMVSAYGALFAGSNLDACLVEVGAADAARIQLCLPRPHPLAIPDSLLEQMFGDLGRRAEAVGLDLDLPTHYPGVVEVRARRDTPVVRTIVADGSDRWAFARDDTLHIVDPPAGSRAEPGPAGWLILRDDGPGLRIWIADVPARPGR